MTELENLSQYITEYQQIVQNKKIQTDKKRILESLEYWNDTIKKAEEELDLLQKRKEEEQRIIEKLNKEINRIQEEIEELKKQIDPGQIALMKTMESKVNQLYSLSETMNATEISYKGYLIDLKVLQKRLSFFYFYRDYLLDCKASLEHNFVRASDDIEELNQEYPNTSYPIFVHEYLEMLTLMQSKSYRKIKYGLYIEKDKLVLWANFPELPEANYCISWPASLEEIELDDREIYWNEDLNRYDVIGNIENFIIPCKLHDLSRDEMIEYGDNEVIRNVIIQAIKKNLKKNHQKRKIAS